MMVAREASSSKMGAWTVSSCQPTWEQSLAYNVSWKEVLNDGVNPRDGKAEILPCGGDKKHFPIAFNALAQIVFTENDYTYRNEDDKQLRKCGGTAAQRINSMCAYPSFVSSLRG